MEMYIVKDMNRIGRDYPQHYEWSVKDISN